MTLISFVWFAAMLFVALTILRLIQAHVSSDTAVGHALAFTLH